MHALVRLGSHQVADQTAEHRILYLGIGCLVYPDELIRFATNKATELAVLTGLIRPLIEASETYMGPYMSLISSTSPQRSAARAAHTAQVSVARLGHLPHLVPHSLALADMAGRALTKSTPTGSSISRSRPEAIFLHICCGFGFASPFFALFFPSLSPLLPLCSNKR